MKQDQHEIFEKLSKKLDNSDNDPPEETQPEVVEQQDRDNESASSLSTHRPVWW